MPCHVRLHYILTWYIDMFQWKLNSKDICLQTYTNPWLRTLFFDHHSWCTSMRNQEKIKPELGDISWWYLSLPDSWKEDSNPLSSHLVAQSSCLYVAFPGPTWAHVVTSPLFFLHRGLYGWQENLLQLNVSRPWHFQYSSTVPAQETNGQICKSWISAQTHVTPYGKVKQIPAWPPKDVNAPWQQTKQDTVLQNKNSCGGNIRDVNR